MFLLLIGSEILRPMETQKNKHGKNWEIWNPVEVLFIYIYIYIYDNRIEKIQIFSFISTGAGFLNYKKYEETFIALLQLHWYGMTLKVCIENPKG